jgi:hypothetical protein
MLEAAANGGILIARQEPEESDLIATDIQWFVIHVDASLAGRAWGGRK